MSHTYVILTVPIDIYEYIRAKLLEAGYQHALDGDIGTVFELIDMHGIALQAGKDATWQSP